MNQHCTIPTGDAAVVFLAEALCRERRLTDVESHVLERAVRKIPRIDRRWSANEDTELLDLKRQRVRTADIGAKIGRTYHAVASRLRYLRRGR